jgi:hypothetical protein
MDAYTSRRSLRRRLLQAAFLAALLVPPAAIGCGAKVAVDGDGNGGTGGTGGGGAGGDALTDGGGGGMTDGGCTLSSTMDGGLMLKPECFAMPDKGCPTQYDAPLFIFPAACVYLVSVNCGPVVLGGECCYMVTEEPQSCPQ